MLPRSVEDIVKSKHVTVGKVFADGAYDDNDIFRCLADNGILPCTKVRKNARVDGKKGTSLEIYQLYPRKKICKSGRIAKAMDNDGWLKKQHFHL